MAAVSLPIATNLGRVYVSAGQPDRAIAQLQKALEIDAESWPARFGLAAAYERKGMAAEAAALFDDVTTLRGLPFGARIGINRYRTLAGRPPETEAILRDVLNTREYVGPVYVAELYAMLGRNDDAIRSLEKADEEADPAVGDRSDLGPLPAPARSTLPGSPPSRRPATAQRSFLRQRHCSQFHITELCGGRESSAPALMGFSERTGESHGPAECSSQASHTRPRTAESSDSDRGTSSRVRWGRSWPLDSPHWASCSQTRDGGAKTIIRSSQRSAVAGGSLGREFRSKHIRP